MECMISYGHIMSHIIWHISYEGLRKLVTQAKGKSFLQVPAINNYRRLFLHQFWIIYRFHIFWFRDNEIKRMSYCANIFQVLAQRLFDCHLIMESSFIPRVNSEKILFLILNFKFVALGRKS